MGDISALRSLLRESQHAQLHQADGETAPTVRRPPRMQMNTDGNGTQAA